MNGKRHTGVSTLLLENNGNFVMVASVGLLVCDVKAELFMRSWEVKYVQYEYGYCEFDML